MWQKDIPQGTEVHISLNEQAISRTGALSLARLFHFFIICGIVMTIRVLLVYLHVQVPWLKWMIIVSETGRTILAVFQEISIMVYSCYHKGIHTWSSPTWRTSIPSSQNGAYERWEANFERQFYDFLNWDYPAKALFWILKQGWTLVVKIKGALGIKQKYTERIFSAFRAPLSSDFKPELVETLKIDIQEVQQNNTTNHLYSIVFENIPQSIFASLDKPLRPADDQRMLFGPVFLSFILIGMVAQIAFSILDVSAQAQSFWLIEQWIVIVFKYYDFSYVKVNTLFEPMPQSNIDAEVGRGGTHREQAGSVARTIQNSNSNLVHGESNNAIEMQPLALREQ